MVVVVLLVVVVVDVVMEKEGSGVGHEEAWWVSLEVREASPSSRCLAGKPESVSGSFRLGLVCLIVSQVRW